MTQCLFKAWRLLAALIGTNEYKPLTLIRGRRLFEIQLTFEEIRYFEFVLES